MSSEIITTGHRGSYLHPLVSNKPTKLNLTHSPDFVPQAAAILARAFIADPTLIYLLSLPEQEFPDYLPKYLEVLLTAATMNGASISQISDWKSCGVVMPAGAYVGNFWTAIQAGWVKVFWKLGPLGAYQVQLSDSHVFINE